MIRAETERHEDRPNVPGLKVTLTVPDGTDGTMTGYGFADYGDGKAWVTARKRALDMIDNARNPSYPYVVRCAFCGNATKTDYRFEGPDLCPECYYELQL